MKENKNYFAAVLFGVGIFDYIFPSFTRGVFGAFKNASDAQTGIASLILISTAIILYFIPEEK